ncbi:MAG: glycosyltransferase [Patescibacteria group bacterium]|jgi:glycosyltransferase involved in cell wall biosynthesis
MKKLSIVIPSKNEEAELPKLLNSIKAQTFSDYEVIVADAHSTDRTREIAESFGAKVVEGAMPGPGRNRGALHAEGEIIAFFDADVQLPSTKFLQECVEEMDRKKLDVATCRVKPLSRKPIDRAMHEVYNAFVIATEKIRPHAPGFCIFVRRSTHDGIKGFDEEVVFAEDHDYVQRADKMGSKFGVLRSHPIAVSVRRLEKDGRLAIALKYVFGELHMLTKGTFKEMPFEYVMGGAEEKKEEKKNAD